MTKQIGFVILHYMTEDDTKNCVRSILENVSKAPIVVVDNGSENGTGEKLKNYYEDNKWVSVLCLERNQGFAKGNNEGIKFMRDRYNPGFIVVMNNDTLIIQNDFRKIVEHEYNISNFAILGPQIITKDGDKGSNPVEYIVDSRKKTSCLLLKRKIKLILCYLHLDFLMHNVGTSVKRYGVYDSERRYEDVKLHGACWIFSQKFFEQFEGLNPKTFLYFEEDILYLEMRKARLKTVYNPELIVIHLEDSSTNSISETSRKKNIFVLKNEIQSLKTVKKILEK